MLFRSVPRIYNFLPGASKMFPRVGTRALPISSSALKIILPVLGNEFVTLIKETAVLSIISITEITRAGVILASHTFSSEPYIGIAICYLCLTITLSRLVAYTERRLATSDRS